MSSNETNPICALHAKRLESIEVKVNDIYDALMGDFEKQGFIAITRNRLDSLEAVRSAKNWFLKLSIGALVTGVVGSGIALVLGVF